MPPGCALRSIGCLAEGASGVATLALASEGYKLTERERDEVAALVVEHVAGRVPVVVSADGAGTAVAVDRAVRAARLGADALMVLPPYLVKPGPAALLDYYTAHRRRGRDSRHDPGCSAAYRGVDDTSALGADCPPVAERVAT